MEDKADDGPDAPDEVNGVGGFQMHWTSRQWEREENAYSCTCSKCR
jgi:hypothetical protein